MEVSIWIVEILHTVKTGTESLILEPRNKFFVYATTFSLTLTLSLLLALVFLLISITCTWDFTFICTCYSSLASIILVSFSLSIKKAIEHLNSYLEEYRGEILDPLTGNPASLLDLSFTFD